MTQTATAAKFELNTRIANKAGAWVELRYDANGGTDYSGVYYAIAGSPEIDVTDQWTYRSRARVERGMTQWLAQRPFSTEDLARIAKEIG
jgi:hypothetical protein